MSIAALDLGKRRLGIAVTDAVGITVHPLCVVERRSSSADIEAVRQILAERHINHVVVGLPLNMDGSEGPMARAVRTFAERLRLEGGFTIEFHDERLSSFEAERRIAGYVRRGKRRKAIDAVAAAVILESWLQTSGGSDDS